MQTRSLFCFIYWTETSSALIVKIFNLSGYILYSETFFYVFVILISILIRQDNLESTISLRGDL